MAEQSAKKAKKEKKRLAMLEQTDLNGSYNSETNTNKKSKKKKDKADTSVTEAKPELPETDLNGSYNSETNTNKKKKKKRDTDTTVTEDLPVINDSAKQSPQKDDAKKSQVRSGKQRMMNDYTYAESLMSLVRLQLHGTLDEAEDPEDEVNDVPAEFKQKMRQENDTGRAATHEELKERLKNKMDELRGRNLSTNEERRKRKLKAKLSKVEKKSAEKEELKQKLMKVGKNAGNLNKIKSDPEAALLAAAAEKPKVKTETGKVVFSKFDFVAEEAAPEDSSGGKKKNLDPKAALAKIQRNKEKLKEMEEAGKTDKVKRINDRVAWQTVMDKAEGVTVKDDVDLLKKAVKKKELKKKSSKAKWEARTEDLEKKKTTFQTKRSDNLQKRKKDVKDNKKKKLIKKGRLVPGV